MNQRLQNRMLFQGFSPANAHQRQQTNPGSVTTELVAIDSPAVIANVEEKPDDPNMYSNDLFLESLLKE